MSDNKYAEGSQAEWFIYWLLRCYQSGHREGWENGPSVAETVNSLHDVLCGEGYDPAQPQAVALLQKKMHVIYRAPTATTATGG